MLAAALEHLVKGIVDNPDDASVTERSTSRGDLLEIHVHPDDLGRVIGRSGEQLRHFAPWSTLLPTARRFALMWWTAISSKTKLRVGRLVKAHGLKGAIKLELYTDSPTERFKPGQLLELQVPETSEWFGKTITVSELRFYNQSPVLFLEGIDDRSKAETLIKAILLIETETDILP